MKHIKPYKIFESSESIDILCKRYDIVNYVINDDGSVDVDGNVFISNRGLIQLPLKLNSLWLDIPMRFKFSF